MSEFLEIVMIVSFGASWPLNVLKSYKARRLKGIHPQKILSADKAK